MTPKQRARLKAAAIQKRLNEIEALPMTSELDKEQSELLATLAMLTPLVNAPELGTESLADAEGDEFRAILSGGSIGAILDCAISGAQTTGREAEIQSHFKLAANEFPVQMLRDSAAIQAAVTQAPADGDNRSVRPVIPEVFPSSVMSFLSIPTPTVPVGESEYVVLTTGATVQTPAEAAAAAESTGTFTPTKLRARRYQTSFRWSREDAASFAPLEMALRQNLSDAMASKLEAEALLNNPNGLLTGVVLADNDVEAKTTAGNYLGLLGYGNVDGKFAATIRDIRILMGGGTYAAAAMEYIDSENALDRLIRASGGVRVSAHVPAVADNKQESIVRIGRRMDAVMPLWNAITMIPDAITKADEGEIRVTAVGLFNFALLRADGFKKQQTQHA